MTNIAFVFPGQGSQSVGMMSNWGDYQTIVSSVYEEASSTLPEWQAGELCRKPEVFLSPGLWQVTVSVNILLWYVRVQLS